MKYLTASLSHDPDARHPMHQFVVETEGYDASELLGSTVTDGGVHTALFHVRGWPPGPYESALAEVPTVREYAVSVQSGETFAVYVRETLREFDRGLIGSFDRAGLVALLPVTYRADGTAEMTLVGPGDRLQAAIDDVPDGVAVDVLDVGEYDTRRITGGPDLTDRQFEAVAAAVARGYYDEPRAAGVDAVADDLDCAPGTAAEHLRRAERTVMRRVVESSGRRR